MFPHPPHRLLHDGPPLHVALAAHPAPEALAEGAQSASFEGAGVLPWLQQSDILSSAASLFLILLTIAGRLQQEQAPSIPWDQLQDALALAWRRVPTPAVVLWGYMAVTALGAVLFR